MINYNLITNEGYGFNIKIINSKPSIIGTNKFSKNLYIGKFVNGISSWHGYPADYQSKNQDKPSDEILEKLLSQGLSLTSIRKIKKGQKL